MASDFQGIPKDHLKIAARTDEAVDRMTKETGISKLSVAGFLGGLGGGDIQGELKGLGFSDVEAKRYVSSVDSGEVLLVTECEVECPQVLPILREHGAFDMITNTPGMAESEATIGGRPLTDRDANEEWREPY